MSAESTVSLGLFFGIFTAVIPIIMLVVAAVIIIVVVTKINGNSKKTEHKSGTFTPQSYGSDGAQPVAQPINQPKPKTDPTVVARIEDELKKLCKNSVALDISGEAEYVNGGTRFGGKPDVPRGFEWPYFETDTFDDKQVKPRPLAFLAQFNLSEISKYDTEDLLPRSGTLAFFYELGSQRWGFDPKDGGCARVYWFHEWEDLSPADFPEDLEEDYRLPALNISAKSEKSYPTNEDYYLRRNDYSQTIDDFEAAEANLGVDYPDNRSKLLGWADVIQGNMTSECELIARGYTSNEVWNSDNFPKEELEKIETAADDWTLLFQLDTVEHKGYELAFGDCGRIYFYIRKDDLKAKRFDRVWLVLQCG